MKMIGRYITFAILATLLALTLCACEDKDSDKQDEATTTTTAVDDTSGTPDESMGGEGDETPDECVHSFGDWLEIKVPTCTAQGMQNRSCTACGKSETEYIDALGHDEIQHEAKTFCTENGWDAYVTCNKCDYTTYREKEPTHNVANAEPTCAACLVAWGEGLSLNFVWNGEGYSVTGLGECTDSKVVIPSIYKGFPVTRIDDYAYCYDGFTNIIIPESVTSIGDYAFQNCDELTNVTIGDSVTNIGDHAFENCDSLTNVTIGCSVVDIGDNAFKNCASLSSIGIPDSVTSIGVKAFASCGKLVSATIGDGVLTIGSEAFYQCDNLVGVYIADIGAWCNIKFDTDSSNPLYYAHNLYVNNTLVRAITIPDNVTSIGAYAFYDCDSLTSVTIGNHVTRIGDYAFSKCSGLRDIIISENVMSVGAYSFWNCDDLRSFTIFNGVTAIDEYAFFGCEKLNSVYINDISAWCDIDFENALSNPLSNTISTLYINGTVMTSIPISDGVTSIGSYAFWGYGNLTSLLIPNSVTQIGHQAFFYCDSLATIYYGGTVDEWNQISIGDHNSAIASATIYYYSETKPTGEENYWRYVNGIPTAW